MSRYTDWHRRVGTEGADPFSIDEAQKLLGIVVERAKKLGLPAYKLQRELSDGTVIIASYNGGIPQLEVQSPLVPTSPGRDTSKLWIPQGFILVPASSSAVRGWGLPATDPDTANPGPLPAAWTAGGPLPQVILTKVGGNGYFRESLYTMTMYFDDWERYKKQIVKPGEGVTWAAFRPAFRGYGASFLAILDEVNSRRAPTDPLVPGFRGFADMAQYLNKLIGKYGVDETTYPSGSNTSFKRVTKDGTPRVVSTGGARGSIGIVDTHTATTVPQFVDLLETAVPALTDTTLKLGATLALAGGGAETDIALMDNLDQWIRCGNLDWKSIHAEIPTISWMGPRGRSVPSYEMLGGVFPTARRATSPFDITAWQTYLVDLSARQIEGGPLENEFSPLIYARGRVLAQLPNSGYVLGAGIQKIPATDTTPLIYRLLAVGWHRADQKYIELIAGGFISSSLTPGSFDATSDIRLWYADMPARNGLAVAPDTIVDGLYDATTNQYGWKAAGRKRLSDYNSQPDHYPGRFLTGSPSTYGYSSAYDIGAPMTYWQTWFFNGSATIASCLRADAWYGNGIGQWSTGYWPSQELRLDIPSNPTSFTVTNIWDISAADIFEPPDVQAYRRLAVDYFGDERRVVALVGDGTNFALMGNSGPFLDLTTRYGLAATNASIQIAYLDARTGDFTYNDEVVASSNVVCTPRIHINGVQVDTASSVTEPNRGSWFDFFAYNLITPDQPGLFQGNFGVMTNPIYASTIDFAWRFFETYSAHRGDDYVTGVKFGYFGAPTTYALTVQSTEISSTIDTSLLGTEPDRLNFVGIV